MSYSHSSLDKNINIDILVQLLLLRWCWSAFFVVWDCAPQKSCCLIFWNTKSVPKFVCSTHITSSEWRWRQWATSVSVMAAAWSKNLSHTEQSRVRVGLFAGVKERYRIWLQRIYIWLTLRAFIEKLAKRWLIDLFKMKMASDTPQWCPEYLWAHRDQASKIMTWIFQCSVNIMGPVWQSQLPVVKDPGSHQPQDNNFIADTLSEECIELPRHCV